MLSLHGKDESADLALHSYYTTHEVKNGKGSIDYYKFEAYDRKI